jgi:hypothetical protein
MNQDRFAPVIEYKGVSILEKHGNFRAVWNGQEYRTDGKAYLFSEVIPGVVGIIVLPNERDAKAVLDNALVGDRILQVDQNTRFRLFSWEECIRLLCRYDPDQLQEALKQTPCRVWDAVAQVFIREGEHPGFIGDGQHRHGNQ